MTVAGAALPRAPQTPAPDDTRRQVASLRRRQALRWGLVVGLIALLVSLFSAGFFLYAAVVAAAVMGLAALLPAASLARVEVRRSLGAAEIELGDSVESRLVFHNRKDFPALWLFWREAVDPGLDAEGLTCGFQTLESEQTIHTVCILHSTRRGLFRVGPMVVEASDPFGLVRRFRVDSEVRFLTVVPRAVPIGQGSGRSATGRSTRSPAAAARSRTPPASSACATTATATACAASTGAPPPAPASCR